MNRFDKLKEIQELNEYEPRHDPSVVPILDASQEVLDVRSLAQPARRKNASAYYTSADYHELYKAGKVTPSDVAEFLIPLIQRDSKPPGKYSVAFLQVREDLVREAAKASTERYKAGKPLSALDGVPIAVKDEVNLTGYRTTKGSRLDFTDKGDRTAFCVDRWIDAGAVIIGKTNMHEIGLDTTNNNVNYGTPLNPHNQGYYTGGSSGGSACSVAQGLCPIALGLDGGGSIRLPASFCGVYGLKPTHGRVSYRAGPQRNWNSVGVAGPIACSIDDLATAYRIMAQPDSESRASAPFPSTLVKNPVGVLPQGGKKYLGVFQDWVNRSDPNVLEMFNNAVDRLVKTQGYEVVQITIPFIPEGQKAHALTILSESRSSVSQSDISKLTYANQLLLNVAGSHATAQDFLFAQRLRCLQMSHLQWLWEEHPGMMVVTPTTPCAGWKIKKPSDVTGYGVSDGDMSLRSMEYVYLANWTGCPAISVPLGYAEGDVPVGFMVFPPLLAFPSMLTSCRQWRNGDSRSSCLSSDAKQWAFWVKKAYEGQNPTNNGLMCCQVAQIAKGMFFGLGSGCLIVRTSCAMLLAAVRYHQSRLLFSRRQPRTFHTTNPRILILPRRATRLYQAISNFSI